jgi:hypothetical protein
MNEAEVARRVGLLAWIRGGTEVDGAAWKEWLHVAVLGRDATVVVNISLLGAQPTRPDARVITLVHDGAGWTGDVVRVPGRDVEVLPSGRGLRAGGDEIAWDGAAWQVRCASAAAGHLTLTPTASPTSVHRLPFGGASRVHWNVTPMSRATGALTAGGRALRFDGAHAYLDHNYGRFDWGGDFVWEWGTFLPDDGALPLVFSRMLDRKRLAVRAAGLMSWERSEPGQYYGDARVRMDFAGRWSGHAARVPKAMALATDGGVVGVPGTITVRGGDDVTMRMQVDHVAQIAVPADADPLATVLVQELVGPAVVHRGARAAPGRAMMELVRVR